MFNWPFKKKEKTESKTPDKAYSTDNDKLFSIDPIQRQMERQAFLKEALTKTFQRKIVEKDKSGMTVAMDSTLKPALFPDSDFANLPQVDSFLLFAWYASQGFIGYQMCVVLAQHWLIIKACGMPGEDATRNGYQVTINDGREVDEKVIDQIKEYDEKYRVDENLKEFSSMLRIFGVRHALFHVDSKDPEYYEKTFNPDSVTPGSYKGISQIDPYWMAPLVMDEGINNPASIDYYEPEFWIVAGKKIHRTHFIIVRYCQVPDILKPTYMFGGVPLTQQIYERVYCAERSANEGPQLLLTKRAKVLKTGLEKVAMNQKAFRDRIAFSVQHQDSFGIQVIDRMDEMIHIDTALADVDSVIMTQYQLVAAISRVPADKLLGTSPKGFNASGEYEQKTYHESLETIQTKELTPVLKRHHDLLIRSEVCPQNKIPYFSTTVQWKPVNSVSAKEQAEIGKLEAEKDAVLIAGGVVDSSDVRKKVINDPKSGYNGLDIDDLPDPLMNELETEELLEGESETRRAQRI